MTKNNLPKWDLTDFYSDINSQELKSDLENLTKMVENFHSNYTNNEALELDVTSFFAVVKELEQIVALKQKLGAYAFLEFATQMQNDEIKSFYQNILDKLNNIAQKLAFFEIAVNKIPDDKFNEFTSAVDYSEYSSWLINIRAHKKHQLLEEFEQLFIEKSSTTKGVVRIYDELLTHLKFEHDNKSYSLEEIFNQLTFACDSSNRITIAATISKELEKNGYLFQLITNILAKDKSIYDKWHKFDLPVESMNFYNQIENEVVENLAQSVINSYASTSHRYFQIKAKILNKEKLHYSDRNAPLPFSDKKIYSWEEAKDLVIKAYHNFSPEAGSIAQKFFDNNWIDVGVYEGKRGGAFSHSTSPLVHPYILVNFQGSLRDVSTLAHEIGHGIHQYLAKKQGAILASTPLTFAETASIFGEQLLFDYILSTETDPNNKITLLANKIEDILNTVIRQIAFHDFETNIHAKRKSKELSLPEINEIWMQTQAKSLGDAFELDPEYGIYWTYIPHFIHSPFYVYSYAFGQCLVFSLYKKYQEDSSEFIPKYLDLLSAGGSKGHSELLKPFDLNLHDKDFWEKGLEVVKIYINELESYI
jgi:oligoendopeptidase F